jgi:hypothetical protein
MGLLYIFMDDCWNHFYMRDDGVDELQLLNQVIYRKGL